mgnify:CR=1 FL=1
MLNIIEGKEVRPVKGTIYGPEGIGKTSFASPSCSAELPDG